ncbi:hypothetical protein [Kitasatospora purpeofusca]|uniref:hypothetical protein n=1 Tax=Kitasatospora purpeofusca TaxID=67352 RepID=UPI0036BAE04C
MNITPGARVRITIEGEVAHHQPGEIALINRARIEYESEDDLTVDVVQQGYQVGDVVRLDDQHLLRCYQDGGAVWIASDGRRIHDDELSPQNLTLVVRATR